MGAGVDPDGSDGLYIIWVVTGSYGSSYISYVNMAQRQGYQGWGWRQIDISKANSWILYRADMFCIMFTTQNKVWRESKKNKTVFEA